MLGVAENMGFPLCTIVFRKLFAVEAANESALYDMTPAFVLSSDWWNPEGPQCE